MSEKNLSDQSIRSNQMLWLGDEPDSKDDEEDDAPPKEGKDGNCSIQ